jgi:single-stranded-DNA-specific exonuclease
MVEKWIKRSRASREDILSVAEKIGVSERVAALFVDRNVFSPEEAKAYTNPSLEQLLDPFLMQDMDKAVNRLQSALKNGQKILVYGDYDVDGTTAVTVVFDFLKNAGADCDYYIPDRYLEGYGFSFKAVEWAIENGFHLIITLDCGIKDGKKIEAAQSAGIDVIVCDHHNPEELPPAYAVLNAKRTDCAYPFKGLSGCGVGFKLLQALAIRTHIPMGRVYEYLDLLTISIGADIVPLVGENRVMAYYGLQLLQKPKRPGIKAMLEVAKWSRNSMSISDVVFILAPRINAAGRMLSGKAAVALLLAGQEEEAFALAQQIEKNNADRKTVDKEITIASKELVDQDAFYQSSFTTVVKKEGWHKGVVGIVASRLVETYYKPAIVLTEHNGMLSGSARSIAGFDLYEALGQCEGLLEQYGGHAMAAGLSLKPELFDAFRQRFDEVAAKTFQFEYPTPVVEYDYELELSAVSLPLVQTIERLGPFGPENMRPTFLSTQVMDSGYSKKVGKELNHAKFSFIQNDGERRLDAVGFHLGEWIDVIKSGQKVDIVYTIELNEFKGNTYLQLQVRSIRLAQAMDNSDQ